MISYMRKPAPDRRELLNLCELIPSGSIMVEVGSFAGESMDVFVRSGKIEKIYCIDPWVFEVDKNWKGKFQPADIEISFDERVTNLKDGFTAVVIKCREYSPAAAEKFADTSLDMVYIDGDHSKEAIAKDIQAWLPKVKTGGIIAGHDYGTVASVVGSILKQAPVVFNNTWAVEKA